MRLRKTLLVIAASSLLSVCCFADSQQPGKAETAERVEKPEKVDTKPFEAAVSLAQSLTQWAYLIMGGSILVLVGNSYHRPSTRTVRSMYFLFVPGWICLGTSIYKGIQVQRAYLAFLMLSHPDLAASKLAINNDAYGQIMWMEWGLSILGVWLLVYLFWWVYGKNVEAKSSR